MSRSPTSYTAPLTAEQAETLRKLLEAKSFSFSGKPYALFSAKKDKVNVTVYEKGPKVLVQGKGTAEFVEFLLEPEVLGEAKMGYEEELEPEMFAPHIGVDESGKGDFFGPLVIAAVYSDAEIARTLLDAGIMDSKKIGSDARIRSLSDVVREAPGVAYKVLVLRPVKYNELYERFANLNRLLAWGHATVIEDVLAMRPDCSRALSDQFANPAVLKRALKERGKAIELQQKTKAESDVAVAAASILAREAFIDWLDQASEEWGETLPKGASRQVKEAGRRLLRSHGREIFRDTAKLHFKTARELYDEIVTESA